MVAAKRILVDPDFQIEHLDGSDLSQLRLIWRNHLGGTFPQHLPRWLLVKVMAYRLQAVNCGDRRAAVLRRLRQEAPAKNRPSFSTRPAAAKGGRTLPPGTLLVRQWRGQSERVMVLEEGFAWNGRTWSSLSQVAKAMTGTHWNGHRFFGLQRNKAKAA